MISLSFQGKPFNITVIQVYAPASNAEEAEVERFYEDLQDLFFFNFYFFEGWSGLLTASWGDNVRSAQRQHKNMEHVTNLHAILVQEPC